MAIFKEPHKNQLTPAATSKVEEPELHRYWSQRCVCGSSRTFHGPSDSITGAGRCERRYCPCRKDGQNTCSGFRLRGAPPLILSKRLAI